MVDTALALRNLPVINSNPLNITRLIPAHGHSVQPSMANMVTSL